MSTAEHEARWRDPYEVTSQWEDASGLSPELLKHSVSGDWWDVLERTGSTLLVSREYEHLVLALTVVDGRPRVSFVPLAHPSGVAYDGESETVFVASTRNPNQIFEFSPVEAVMDRSDRSLSPPEGNPLVPVRSRFLPGALYIHDLAVIGGELHANAVGENAVVRIDDRGSTRVWWPRCIDGEDGPATDRNYLQLNSIAAGRDVRGSFYSASADRISARRPGHRNFPVDGRGVVFSGETREPLARGLTRPHSARLDKGDRLWVDNSGYGQTGTIEDGRFEPVAALPGWTRGLSFAGEVAFVATSRVIPRFRQYAPGLDVDRAMCAVHAIDTETGSVLGSIRWPSGNQIFALELMPRRFSLGFPLYRPGRQPERIRDLFYAFIPNKR